VEITGRRVALFLAGSFVTILYWDGFDQPVRAIFLIFMAVLSAFGSLCGQTSRPVILLFAGDVTLARHIGTDVGRKVGYVFQKWEEVGEYDFFMVNLEDPITLSDQAEEKEFTFRMHPRYVRTLETGRINIVDLANNHIGDYGAEGLDDTMHYLDSAGIHYVGAGRDLQQARRPLLLEKNGERIGILAYAGGDFCAGANKPGFAPRYDTYVVSDVKKLRNRVDYLVVGFHWGTELAERPSSGQVKLAHEAIDAGADLVIGHHPHTLQGIERYKTGVVAYSLGNFVFGGNHLSTYPTAVLKVVLRGRSSEVELVPIEVTRWQPHLPAADVAERIVDLVRERSRMFPQSIPFPTGASR
jgi:poly-gamma-glutamate capsule biosynthesis protein CapA/YwtB (metallophosphatase superfamily)